MTAAKIVLNVGGSGKHIPLPPQYEGWRHVLLDIDARSSPDIVHDARQLGSLPTAQYDAVYCSHNLEHYYPHDVPKVLAGFRHVLRGDGFVHILVPDIASVMRIVVEKNLDIAEVLYQSQTGPVTVRDVIYGYAPEIEQSGNDFYAHKTGFTRKSLAAELSVAGFRAVFVSAGDLEIRAIAFPTGPTPYATQLFGLPPYRAPG